MRRPTNPVVVGGFVVGALVLLLAGILAFGSGNLFRERVQVVSFFSGNVRGLQEGSLVEFRGVRVGTVTSINLVFDQAAGAMRIPVTMDLEPERLTVLGPGSGLAGIDNNNPEAFLDDMVVRGMRARLDMKSVLTGQLAVSFDMMPETPVQRVGAGGDVYEMPTVPSTLDRVAQTLQELPLEEIAGKVIAALDSAERILSSGDLEQAARDVAAAAADTRRLVSALESRVAPLADAAQGALSQADRTLQNLGEETSSTLAAYTDLARDGRVRLAELGPRMDQTLQELGAIGTRLDERLAPMTQAATVTLDEARTTLGNAGSLLAEDSRTRYNLDVTLEELASAARSLRIMADFLEQHPDALLRGK